MVTRITTSMTILINLMSLMVGSIAQEHPNKKLTLDDIFPVDRVLDVQITVDRKDWNTIRFQSRSFETEFQEKRMSQPIDPPYTYVKASVSIDGVEFPQVGIRKKGFFGSQSTNRPSLKIKLNHLDKRGGIGGLTNLTFNNNQQDSSLMSQFMSYALFNQAGSPAPRCAYAKVTVNGNNLGIYSHVETIRQPLLERAFGNDGGTLYEGTVVDFSEGWEGSFEKEIGEDKPGREKIKQLIQALQGEEGEILLNSKAPGRGWVSTDSRYDEDWVQPDFDDSNWKQGWNGAGYEKRGGYQSLISDEFDFGAEMYNQTNSLYLRFPFEIENLEQTVSSGELILGMKYDDGFVAYLNGHRVAALNAPEKLDWTSKATASHEAAGFDLINISEHKDKLQLGKNVLAIQGLNVGLGSSDMLIVAEIQLSDYDYEQGIGELVDLDAFYRFWVLEGLLGFWDGYSANRNNYFFYLNPETDKFHFLPWGADSLFEKFSRLGVDPQAPVSVKTQGLIAQRLYQIKSCRKRYAKTMKEILDKHWHEEALLAETERLETLLEPYLIPSQKREMQGQQGWREFISQIGRDKQPTSLNSIRDFIRHRRAEIMNEIANGMPVR